MSLILVAIVDLAIVTYIGCLLVSLMGPPWVVGSRSTGPTTAGHRTGSGKKGRLQRSKRRSSSPPFG